MRHEIFIQELDLDELLQEAIDEALGRYPTPTEQPSNLATSWDEGLEKVFNTVNEETFDTVENQVFRRAYRPLTDYQKAAIEDIKIQAAQLLSLINAASSDSRCSCIARTRLEEAVMWAVKGIS